MNYWERRQQELNSALEKDEAKLKKRLSSFYDTEYRKLEKEIAAYYSIYGENKVIEYRNLMQNLSDEDKEQMIKRMQDFVQLYPEYADLLPVRESIYKLNRLEGLQMSVRIQQYEMGAIDNEEIRRHLMRQAVRSANVAAETMGYGKNFYSEDSIIIKTVVNTKWSNGKDFSERIWGNVEKLAQYLNTDIAAGFARGDSYERMTRQLRQRFGKVSRNDAYRLIYTEGTFVMNEARAAAFEADTEEYIFRVQYDKARRNGWRDICDDLNEEIFKWSERKPGINFPPMHPWCHCTATPHIANRQKWLDDYEKRHRNGQAEKVANRLDSGIMDLKNIDDLHVDLTHASNDLLECSLHVNNFLNTLDLPDSKWSGVTKVVSLNELPNAVGVTKANGDILLRKDAGIKTVIHEHLHTRSVLYNKKIYRKYKWFEENACEMLAEELCNKNGISYKRSYKNVTEPLRDIAGLTSQYVSDYDFALDYFNAGIENRESWLIELANKETDLSARNRIIDLIGEIRNAEKS